MIFVKKLDEFRIISDFFSPLSRNAVGAFDLKDDACLLSLSKKTGLIVTADSLVEGVHFLRNSPAKLIGQRLFRVNLSDIVSKGGLPIGYFLLLGIDSKTHTSWIKQFSKGLKQDQEKYNVNLFGGDTVRVPKGKVLSIVMLGKIFKNNYRSRLTAKPKNLVFVTGLLGDSYLGLACLKKNSLGMSCMKIFSKRKINVLKRKFYLPSPPANFGRKISAIATSSTDLSDGLLMGLNQISRASKVGMRINLNNIPLSRSIDKVIKIGKTSIDKILTHGDDYEILFTVNPRNLDQVYKIAKTENTRVSLIGTTDNSKKVLFLDSEAGGMRSLKGGFSHF